MMKNGAFLFSLGVLVMLSLVSCQVGEETAVANTQTPVTTPTALAAVSTATLTPTATMEATPLPTATATQTPVVTLTPLPTFAPDELETAVADLLANPMNCDVPCWWGAIPDETTFFEIHQFLELHQLTDYMRYLSQEAPNDRFELLMGYYNDENGDGRYDFRVSYGFQNDVLTSLVSGHAPLISDVIEKFGQPDEILISASNDVRTWPPLIKIYLVYLQESMALGYVTVGDVQSDLVKACFADEMGFIHLKQPNSVTHRTLYEDFSMFYPEDNLYFPLEEATGLTMKDFMEDFSDPTQSQCIETPIGLWEWE